MSETEREPCVCGVEGSVRLNVTRWHCISCGRHGPFDDVTGEKWDRDMRDIRAGREAEESATRWADTAREYANNADYWRNRAEKAEAENMRLAEELSKAQGETGRCQAEILKWKVAQETERADNARLQDENRRLRGELIGKQEEIARLELAKKPARARKLTAVLRDVPLSDLYDLELGDQDTLYYLWSHRGASIQVEKHENGYRETTTEAHRYLRAEWLEDIREEWEPQKGEAVIGGDSGCEYLGWYEMGDTSGHMLWRRREHGKGLLAMYFSEVRPIEEAQV